MSDVIPPDTLSPISPDTPTESALPEGWLRVKSLDLEAQGVAHRPDGKVVFIDGALPFEVVSAQIHRSKSSFEKGTLTEIHQESSQRVRPACPHFGLHEGACGGCKMQHLHVSAQVAVKQRVLEDNLWHIGKVKPDNILRPIEGPAWGYRYRARLSVRHVRKKGQVLIGFHERKSRYVADMKECHVLAPHVSAMLVPLRRLIESMDAVETLAQIELAMGDMAPTAGANGGAGEVIAMVLRHLEPLSEGDLSRLRDFAAATGLSGNAHEPRRYLWTDAFAVCNFLELYRQTGEDIYLETALKLVAQVHFVLGRYSHGDVRKGWISGLDEQAGYEHPTCGGLRIGKKLPERKLDEPFDERIGERPGLGAGGADHIGGASERLRRIDHHDVLAFRKH